MTRKSTTRVNFEKETSTPKILTKPIQTQIAFTSEMIKAAINAPGIDPMPPTTTTTNAEPIVWISRSRLADSLGSCRAPPSPANIAPIVNTEVNKIAWLTPKAATISRSWVAALIKVPQRVFFNKSQSNPNITGPITIRKRS